jgi:RNA polymerase sigma-70 factor (ECF subfamily)
VLAAGDSNSTTAREALERLCQGYWYPLYVYVRRQGYSPEDAQDLTQAFFERVLEKNYFAQVDPAKGRFRAFLLASLKHFLSDQRDRARAAKRGGGKVCIPLDGSSAEDRYQVEPADTLSPDRLYDRRWAFTLLEKARERLREEHVASGKVELYELLNTLEPSAGDKRSYREVAERLATTESAIKSEAFRLRRRYGQLIRAEIAQTVATVGEIEDEVRYLMSIIAE